MSPAVKIACEGADTLPLDDLISIQGGLKKLSDENAGKLERSIIKHGFIAPIFVWVSGQKIKKYNILDGTQRVVVLSKMRDEGYKIPELPVALVENMMLNSSKKGQLCCDPFLGSGTSIIAAEKTGRRCIAIEIEPHYCDVSIKRYIEWCLANDREVSIKRNGKTFDHKLFLKE